MNAVQTTGMSCIIMLAGIVSAHAACNTEALISGSPWEREGAPNTWTFTGSQIKDVRFNGSIKTTYTMDYSLSSDGDQLTYSIVSAAAEGAGGQQPDISSQRGRNYTMNCELSGSTLTINNTVRFQSGF